MDFKNKNIIVTGGNSGLGNATCNLIEELGGNCISADIGKKSETTKNSVICDVTSEDDVKNLVEFAVNNFESIHGLVNCAGVAIGEKTLGRNGPHRLDSFAKVININLIGSFNCSRLVAEKMQSNEPNEFGERGVIINTASVAAYDGQLGQAAYAASKGGIVGMTLPMARDLSKFGIRVVTVAPGIFETPMLLGMPQEVQDSLGKQVPFPSRLGKPKEFAIFVKSIFENIMLNGETIRLDGAIRMGPK